MKTVIVAWVLRHIIAKDPNPEYSGLDRVDGLTGQGGTR